VILRETGWPECRSLPVATTISGIDSEQKQARETDQTWRDIADIFCMAGRPSHTQLLYSRLVFLSATGPAICSSHAPGTEMLPGPMTVCVSDTLLCRCPSLYHSTVGIGRHARCTFTLAILACRVRHNTDCHSRCTRRRWPVTPLQGLKLGHIGQRMPQSAGGRQVPGNHLKA